MSQENRIRVAWTNLETHFMLVIMKEKNILSMLDAKRYRNKNIFQVVEEELKKRGFLKSVEQIRAKWKQLKMNYYKAKRNNQTSGSERIVSPFWEELDELLGHRAAVNIEGGVESSQEDLNTETSLETSYQVEWIESAEIIDISSVDPSTSNLSISVEPSMDTSTSNLSATPSSTLQSPKTPEATRNPLHDASSANVINEPVPGTSSDVNTPRMTSTKRGKKNSYKEALSSFTKEWKAVVEETSNSLLDRQATLFKKEMEEQRKWETQLLEEERTANEAMINNMMGQFFTNLKTVMNPNPFPLVFPSTLAPQTSQFNFPSSSLDPSSKPKDPSSKPN